MIEHTRHPVPSASKGAARRRRVEGGRHHAVKIRFTDAEYDAIAARATTARVSVQRFLVGCALTRRHQAAAPSALTAELVGLKRLVANLANNVNQIARRLNSGSIPDASIPAAADSIQRAMRRLEATLSCLDTNPPDPAPAPAIRSPDLPPADSGIREARRITAPPHQSPPGVPG